MNRLSLMMMLAVVVALGAVMPGAGEAEVCNIKVVTDASPDFTDMDSMVRSVTAKWPTMREKCWAMYYWVHIGRRQVKPAMLHGTELGDPIRQFNDWGYAMCSTVSGINNAIWNAMGMKVRFRDMSMHTTSECYYDNAWHCYDDSMSAVYTLCDGKTVAGVEDVGRELGCEASGGKVEPGHIAKYHCLSATSANGFLTGTDGTRDVNGEYGCFNWRGLKYYPYWCGWEQGHRYILNLRDGEVYTRYYHQLDSWIKGKDGKMAPDPQASNYYADYYDCEDPKRTLVDPDVKGFHIRGSGLWVFKPSLAPADYKNVVWTESNMAPAGGALAPAKAGQPACITWRISSANLTTSMKIVGTMVRKTDNDQAAVSVSTDNGIRWKEVWKADSTGELPLAINLRNEVNGAYDTLIRFDLNAKASPADAAIKNVEFRTLTQVNSKVLPRLNIGKNVIYIGAGEQTNAITVWPDYSGAKKDECKVSTVSAENVACGFSNWEFHGNLYPVNRAKDASVVYGIDSPRDITSLRLECRYETRQPNDHVDMAWSVDQGKTWTQVFKGTGTEVNWDRLAPTTVVAIPESHKNVWVKYLMGGGYACIYSTHIEAMLKPVDASFKPIEVQFAWKEVQPDHSLVQRSHTKLVDRLPCRYEINTAGSDQPVMESLQVNLQGSTAVATTQPVKYGYSDGKENGQATKFVYQWQTVGKNLAMGKKYTTSIPSDKPGKGMLTDGVVGPNFAGGLTPMSGECWNERSKQVDIDLDLEKPTTCGAFAIQITSGWPWPQVCRGDWTDAVELLTSDDAKTWTSRGTFNLNRWHKDIPINYMVPDNEELQGYNFDLVLPKPVTCRYARWHYVFNGHSPVVTEIQAMDSIKYEPFDIGVALPDEKVEPSKIDPATLKPPTMDTQYNKQPQARPASK